VVVPHMRDLLNGLGFMTECSARLIGGMQVQERAPNTEAVYEKVLALQVWNSRLAAS